MVSESFNIQLKGGGGGGGVQAFHFAFGKINFELGVEGKGQDTSRNFEGNLGPYVQYCPCEASEQKLEQKPKSGLKVIELSYSHHSICLLKTSGFWTQFFFGGLNQKSTMISMCKIHIYID